MTKKQTVYLVDDDTLLLKTLSSVFRFSGFEVREFRSPFDFLESNICSENACVVLDLNMPYMTGLELQERLALEGVFLPVVIYTGDADVQATVRAMASGAFTLVQKPCSNQVLVETVRKAMKAFNEEQEQTQRLTNAHQRLETLSEREKEVAMLVAEGLSSSEIAEKLGVGRRTAESHRSNILQKLQLKSTAALIELVVLAGLTSKSSFWPTRSGNRY